MSPDPQVAGPKATDFAGPAIWGEPSLPTIRLAKPADRRAQAPRCASIFHVQAPGTPAQGATHRQLGSAGRVPTRVLTPSHSTLGHNVERSVR